MSKSNDIKVTVQNTEETLFEGIVDRITSFNEIGQFDIYPMHANFISILGQKLALYNKKKKIHELNFEKAVIKAKRDVVDIYLGIEVLLFDDKNPTPQETHTPKK